MTFMPWPEIEAFHHIRKFVRIDPNEWFLAREKMSGSSTVKYKAKVKLHGTNAAVQVHVDGTVEAQSRTNLITPEKDNAGFARWVANAIDQWRGVIPLAHLSGLRKTGYVLFGEWCGPSIQKGVALSQIPKKIFAVFAARPLDGSDSLIIEPEDLSAMVAGIPDVYVLPWHASIDIDWRQSDEELTKSTAAINEWVLSVEENDPWVEKTFGVKGTGEGLVFYPAEAPHLGYENFSYLVFKAKGEKHKNIATAKPAQVNAEAAASIDAFVDLVLTPARLEQGARAIQGEHKHEDKLNCLFCEKTDINFDMKLTGKFVTWILSDVQKETTDELEASNLTWKDVLRPLSDRARTWYLNEAKK